MQITAILIGILILAVIGWYVSRPLLHAERASAADSPVASLEVQRDSLYAQISELDLDRATGKTNEEDYQRLRKDLVGQAADILRQIDGQVYGASDQDADIEAMIAARRKSKPAGRADLDQQLEDAIKARRTAIVCPKCGKSAAAGDTFCSRCGTALPQPQRV